MPSFRDALKNYKNRNGATQPAESADAPTTSATSAAPPAVSSVNPPEAADIMEKQTVPETEGQPEPQKPEPEKKTRAPRGSKKASAEPTASTDSGPTIAAPVATGDIPGDLVVAIRTLQDALPAGVSVTVTGR